MGKYRVYAILIAAVVAATALAFVLPGEQGQTAAMMAVTFAVITGFSALVSWPAGGAFVERSPNLFKALGGMVEALAVACLAWGLAVSMSASTPSDISDSYIIAAVIMMLTGALLFIAPRTARQSREVRALQEAKASAVAPTQTPSDGVDEGVAAIFRFAKDLRPFFTIVWLWLVLSCGPVLLAGAAWATGHMEPVIQVVAIGVGWLCFIIGLPTVLVAWHRWLIQGRRPERVPLPDRAAFSYGWRLWIYVALAGRVANWASEAAGHWALQGAIVKAFVPAVLVNALVFAVICALFSLQALRLAAVAVGDTKSSLAIALVAARRMRLALPLGVLVAMAPFFAFRALAGISILATGQTLTAMAITFAMEFAVQFFAFAAAAALVSSAYMKVIADVCAPLASE